MNPLIEAAAKAMTVHTHLTEGKAPTDMHPGLKPLHDAAVSSGWKFKKYEVGYNEDNTHVAQYTHPDPKYKKQLYHLAVMHTPDAHGKGKHWSGYGVSHTGELNSAPRVEEGDDHSTPHSSSMADAIKNLHKGVW